jgi:hypothetical protein
VFLVVDDIFIDSEAPVMSGDFINLETSSAQSSIISPAQSSKMLVGVNLYMHVRRDDCVYVVSV